MGAQLENLRRSRGLANLPSVSVLAKELDKLPEKFAPAKRQALITRDVSVEIARQMAAKGIPVNFHLLEVAHLARLITRHHGSGTAEGVGAVKAVKPTRVAEKILRRVYRSPELAEMVARWYSLGNPKVLPRLRAEEVAFLLGGYMTYGYRGSKGKWRYSVVPPSKVTSRHGYALSAALEKAPREKKNEIEAYNRKRREFLTREYREGVKPIAEWLENQGIDLRQVASEVKHRLGTGYYDVLEKATYGKK